MKRKVEPREKKGRESTGGIKGKEDCSKHLMNTIDDFEKTIPGGKKVKATKRSHYREEIGMDEYGALRTLIKHRFGQGITKGGGGGSEESGV